MHDWTLKNVSISWSEKRVCLDFESPEKAERIILENFSKFTVTAEEPWGASVSVNKVKGPILLENGKYFMHIEMQSGDIYEIEAKSIYFSKD